MRHNFLIYLAVMAGVTYLVRLIPLLLIKKEIKNRFILSFLHYMPYSVLSVMTVPAIFYATSSIVSATIGFTIAIVLAYFRKSLLTVAFGSCLGVLICEIVMTYII